MAYQLAVPAYTLNMPAGSAQSLTLTFTIPQAASSPPYPITGLTWEYCVRQAATSGGAPLVSITDGRTGQGLITPTATASVSQILLFIAPFATASLAPGAYSHALWSSPGTASAFPWFTGSLILTGTPQP